VSGDCAATKRAEWAADLETIRNAAHTMFHDRQLWREYTAMIDENGVPSSVLFDAQFRWYSNSQVVAVRRLVDDDARAVSLQNLLVDMSHRQFGRNAEGDQVEPPLTREWFVDEWMRRSTIPPEFEGHHRSRGQGAFDLVAGEGEEILPASKIADDRRELLRLGKPLVDFVNRHIAHADRERDESPPTIEQLDDFIDAFGGVVRKYNGILSPGESLTDLVPVIQDDWKAPFRRRWIQ
jgi:hypothetical protein